MSKDLSPWDAARLAGYSDAALAKMVKRKTGTIRGWRSQGSTPEWAARKIAVAVQAEGIPCPMQLFTRRYKISGQIRGTDAA